MNDGELTGSPGGEMRWAKAIRRGRDRRQSLWLVVVMVPVLVVAALVLWVPRIRGGDGIGPAALAWGLSFAFAALVWAMRSATLPAAGVGMLVCLALAGAGRGSALAPSVPAGVAGLVVLFGLTFSATRYGRRKKEAGGLAEARSGRRASQVVANLGIAAVCAMMVRHHGPAAEAASLAALAEATADTLSSEVGQAVGGVAWMITGGGRVPAGTDGAVSLVGTVAGIVGAAAVAAVAVPRDGYSLEITIVFVSACAGLVFDSLLGATVERRGWLGNDLVNFTSTVFSAGLAAALVSVVREFAGS